MIHNCSVISRKLPDSIIGRYKFSRYIIDPNRRRFHTVIRITAWVIRFIKILKNSLKKKVPPTRKSKGSVESNLSETEIQDAEKYFFKAATAEVKHFMKEKEYKKFSEEKNEILMYTGRILATEVCAVTPMTAAMKDLCSTTFCVPIIEKYSPIA